MLKWVVGFHRRSRIVCPMCAKTQPSRIGRGGDISATVSAVGCLMVGKDDVAVYDGSLSEWVGEGLPTTRGPEPGRLD